MNVRNNAKELTLGVDTHLEKHVAVLIDNIGQVVDTKEIAVTNLGYSTMYKWCISFGNIKQAGIEGTGTYGAGLCKYLQELLY